MYEITHIENPSLPATLISPILIANVISSQSSTLNFIHFLKILFPFFGSFTFFSEIL